MSILDDLLALDEEEDRRIADELAKASKEPTPIIKDIGDSDWEIKDAGQSNKTASTLASKPAPMQRDTRLKRVLMSKLVWAKCNFFKGGSPYFPGRIADPSEAACQKNIPTTIEKGLVVIEFFCIPKNDPVVPQYVLVPKADIRPFDSACGGKRQLSFTQSYSRGKEGNEDGVYLQWDIDSNENMRQRLKVKYNHTHANTVYLTIKAKAKEFLINALDYEDTGGNKSDDCSADKNYDSNTDGATSPASEKGKKKNSVRSPESEHVVDLFSLVSKRGLGSAPQTISAGRWISFQHKIFKDRTVYIRVVEVTGNPREPVLLENDDVLRPRDVVCLLDELPPNAKPPTSSDPQAGAGSGPDKYGKRLENVFVEGGGGYVKGSGSSRPLEEYTFKKGKINFVSLQEELLKETRKCGSILEERPASTATAAAAAASNASSVSKWEAYTKSSKAGSTHSSSSCNSSSNSSSKNNGRSIRDILTVDDDDDDDVIICVDTPDKPVKARAAIGDKSNFSDDSDQPIYSMIQKRKRIQAEEAQRSRAVRSPSPDSDS